MIKQLFLLLLYASVGRGGGTGDIGRLYGYQYFSGDLNYNGRYALRNPLNGHVDFDKIYSSNSGQATTFYNGRTYSNVVDAATEFYISLTIKMRELMT